MLIVCNFSGGIEMVSVSVSTSMPRHTTWVLGGTNFLLLTVLVAVTAI